MHYIGYGTACPPPAASEAVARMAQPLRDLDKWRSSFGEGFAVLAAAGGPGIHPQSAAKPELRDVWDRWLQWHRHACLCHTSLSTQSTTHWQVPPPTKVA